MNTWTSRYRRVLLKLSGESLNIDRKDGDALPIDSTSCKEIAETIRSIADTGVQVGIVIGGGNIFRGKLADEFCLQRSRADQVGMFATMINGLLLAQVIASLGKTARVMSARPTDGIIEPYNWVQANEYLERGNIVIFVGGTGNPYFTTDTAAALRASEIGADLLLKMTKVDGIFTQDPMKCADAKLIRKLSYVEALTLDVQVMDATAIALCRENQIPIAVCNLCSKEDIMETLQGRAKSIIQEKEVKS